MKVKTIVLLAATAIAAIALAVPAAASEAVWLHKGKPLEAQVELSLTGGEVFEIPDGGMFCEAKATLRTEGGSTAQITEFEVPGEGCIAFGEFAGCKLIGAEAQGLPWEVDVETEVLTVSNADIQRTFDSECPIEDLVSEVGKSTWMPNSTTAIEYFEFAGKGSAKVNGSSEAAYTSFGSFQIDGEDSLLFGIG